MNGATLGFLSCDLAHLSSPRAPPLQPLCLSKQGLQGLVGLIAALPETPTISWVLPLQFGLKGN